MDRPSGPPFPSTKRPTTSTFATPSPNYQQSLSPSASSQHNPSFTSLSTHIPSQVTSDPTSTQQITPSLLLDHSVSILDNRLDHPQRSADLLHDLNVDLTSHDITTKHEFKVPSHEPWNSLNLATSSANSHHRNSLSNLQQSKKRPHTDSGYASSQKSRPRISTNLQPDRSFEIPRSYVYDEPIGSAAQQHHFLFDQQRRPTPTVSTASVKTASVVGDPSLTPSVIQTFRCEECAENFNTKSEMSKHMARHNKKHVCDVHGCSRATDGFATKNDLDRHKGSVHHDRTVTRKEFKCRVPNCKDPNKIWDRKDNFKAHVKRMHPDVDPDAVVEASYVGEKTPQSERANSHAGSHVQDFGLPNYGPTTPNPQMYYPPTTGITDTPFNTVYDRGPNEDPFNEGDMYDSPTTAPRPQHYPPQLDPRSYPYVPTSNYLSPAAAVPHHYTQSNTIVASSNAQDTIAPLFAHRVQMMPAFTGGQVTTNRTRPLDAQTAPPMGQANNEFRTQPMMSCYPSGDTSSLTEGNLAAIDPSLQLNQSLAQSGSWVPSPTNYPQHADIPDQPLPSNLTVTAAEQCTTSPVAINERCDAMQEEIQSILKGLSPDEMKSIIELYKRHPQVPNKDACRVKTAIDTVNDAATRPYKCGRDGCDKRFTQKNIRKKHEKRHDRLFFCTFDGCYSTFGTKDDLRRHEFKKHQPHHFQGWRCFPDDVPTSQYKRDCFKFFDNKEMFKQHRRDVHKERAEKNNGDLKAVKNCQVHQGSPGHFWCGFCNRVILNEPNGTDGTKRDKFRYDHLDHHITKEKKTMRQWIDLRSEGLTKVAAEMHAAINDESDDEEDTDMHSPTEITTTIGASSSYIPAPLNQQRLEVSAADGRNRKRAYSDAEYNPPFPVKASRTVNYQQPTTQATMMSGGTSDLPTSGSSPTQPQLSRQATRPSVAWVQCCQCKYRRHVTNGETCGHLGCFHTRCPNCNHFDNMSNLIHPKPAAGQGRGGGA